MRDSLTPIRTISTDPTRSEWKLRCLLAQSLVSHRRTSDGMDAAAVELLWQALNGRPTDGS